MSLQNPGRECRWASLSPGLLPGSSYTKKTGMGESQFQGSHPCRIRRMVWSKLLGVHGQCMETHSTHSGSYGSRHMCTLYALRRTNCIRYSCRGLWQHGWRDSSKPLEPCLTNSDSLVVGNVHYPKRAGLTEEKLTIGRWFTSAKRPCSECMCHVNNLH